ASTLLLDMKGAFDHVSKNQLLSTCKQLGLPYSLCQWISCFLTNRKMQLQEQPES
ncbi:hypothetical protein M501DRAFT_927182, partial [Patellaria atrata CBS 101060]